MGWCSGTEFFDDGLSTFLKYVPEDKKFEVVREWYDSFRFSDWDCQGESNYYEDYIRHFEVEDDGINDYDTVLYINRSDSRCSCGVGAFPSENGHYTAAGWDNKVEPCGEMWSAVSSEYVNMAETMTRNTYGYDNLIGLPVVHYDGRYLGMYGGKTRENAAVPEVRDEEDITVHEADEDLR
ncbi:hypothetical protein PP460_gp137 [Streptomyces phage Muntaha]|uniref:Uncharacterized protein n=1 Tax=Streptomyces phage Muntaha TaxID=2713269 RepID=A0A6G8R384_9CAUD|nr:hypothetical protein PP460_gp137 [Streptomyces phage Muntaha]QIN94665.1 hypothetical protein SEA_MUNTAHA_134 [Streptomyces phage Muntaha]